MDSMLSLIVKLLSLKALDAFILAELIRKVSLLHNMQMCIQTAFITLTKFWFPLNLRLFWELLRAFRRTVTALVSV